MVKTSESANGSEVAQVAPPAKAVTPPLAANACKRAEYERVEWRVYADVWTADELLDPALWQYCSSIKRFDHIEVIRPDGRKLWDALCVEKTLGFCKVIVLREVDLPAPERVFGQMRIPDGYEILFGDAEDRGYYIRRKRDGFKILSTGGVAFRTEEQAVRHLLDMAIFRDPNAVKHV